MGLLNSCHGEKCFQVKIFTFCPSMPLWLGSSCDDDQRASTVSARTTSSGDSGQWLVDIHLNPVWIPPLNWSDEDAMYQHGEMEMIAASHAGGAGQAKHGVFRYRFADFGIDLAHMRVEAENALAVVK